MPGDELLEKRQALGDFKTLQDQIADRAYLKAIFETTARIDAFPAQLESIRAQGYDFGRDVAGEIEALGARWAALAADASAAGEARATAISARLTELKSAADALSISEGLAAQIQANKLLEFLAPLQAEMADMTAEAERVAAGIAPDVEALAARLAALDSYVKRTEEASFAFNAGEAVYIALEVEWKKGKHAKEAAEGVLYVTDQRVIMEQREKQGGFMGLGGKMVQTVLWQVPLVAIRQVTALSAEPPASAQQVHMHFEEGGPFTEEQIIELKGDVQAEWFAARCERALRGEIVHERWGTPEAGLDDGRD
jgi:hypothetical protein